MVSSTECADRSLGKQAVCTVCTMLLNTLCRNIQCSTPEDGHNDARNMLSYCIINKQFFDVLLTVHLSIFISVINQLDVQNFVFQLVYFMPLHVSSTCANNQEVKIVLQSLWYHHIYMCDDTNAILSS